MKFHYSRGWFRAKKKPLALYSESEAKTQHDNLDLYCVLVNDVESPTAFIEINNDFYGVAFLDEHLRNNLDYQFTIQENGKLFLEMSIFREYKDSTDKVIAATTYKFKPDGETIITKSDLLTNEKLESKTTSDVTNNWESLPEFGCYMDLLKHERSS
ncbi:MAG: hypothetical protein KUG79_19410 [Pseudomonadales bacterium]|nr:hypothetical protein [Pseudomonadales bacterium]